MLPRIQILLIEDNDGDARLIQEYLRESPNARYRLTRASTLGEGLQYLESENPDVVLLDLGLPDCHRNETLPRLVQAYPQLPVVVMTSDSDINHGIEALGQGAQDYLSKFALNAEPLTRTIRHAIERKQLTRRLEEAERIAALGTWEWMPLTKSFKCTDVFYKILGINWVENKLTSFRQYIDLIPSNQRKDLHDAFDRLEVEGGSYDLDHPIQLGDDSRKWVSLKIHTDTDGQGRTNRVIGTVQDISDRKRIESLERENELAARAARLRQEFLAKTSHEIRTPLNPILVLTDLLMGTDTTDEQKEHLVAIKTAGETLLAVVNDILDLAKIEAGKIDFKKDSFSPQKVFNSLGDMMELNAKAKGLDFKLELDERIPEKLIGDTVRLTQILLNLVNNAIKFTNNGRIDIQARQLSRTREKVSIEFSVADTGIGIPQDKLKEIFENFRQLDGEANRRHGGTGLGLSIVRQLVKLQGGSISVSSQPLKGSTFTFILEFDIDPTATEQTKPSELDFSLVEGLNILLVEDNPLNQMVTKRLLGKWGIDIDIANNGREGVEKLEEGLYDLVLMDVQMPEMDGYEATRHIRKHMPVPKRDIAIIALTANAFTGSNDECLQAGMDDYLSKPIEINFLYEKIVQHTRRKPNGHSVSDSPESTSSPQEPIMSLSKYTNLTYLSEISAGDSELIQNAVQTFLDTTPAMLDNMDYHFKADDFEAMAKSAHKMKSSAAFMGIEALEPLILQVEAINRQKQGYDALPKLTQEIRAITEVAFDELKAFLNTPGGNP